MRNTVGISHRLKRAWLDDLLDSLVQTRDEKALRAFVDQRLRDELPGKDARAKAAGILLRIWSGVEPKHVALRDRAVVLLPRISGQERIWLHWGMAALAYPFFRDLAEVIGRMLTLQDDITNAQVQTRLKTAWGDRETSKEAAGKLITSMVDWEVLRATKTKGHFLLARKMTTSVTDLQLWLLEAMLSASASDEIEAHQLLRLPELFPFSFTVSVGDLRRHEGFNIHRQGLDMDMVFVRRLNPDAVTQPTAQPARAAEAVQPSFFDEQTENRVSTSDSVNSFVPAAADEKQGSVRMPVVAPNVPFMAPSAECAEQFRAGHYFSCIALTHSLLEAVVQHIGRAKLKVDLAYESSFEKNLVALYKNKFISRDLKFKLEQTRTERHSFHHLLSSIVSNDRKLEETARNNLELLKELEKLL